MNIDVINIMNSDNVYNCAYRLPTHLDIDLSISKLIKQIWWLNTYITAAVAMILISVPYFIAVIATIIYTNKKMRTIGDKTDGDFSDIMPIDHKPNTEAGEEENQPSPWNKKEAG